MKANSICWIFLILLTLAGVIISDLDQSSTTGLLVLSAAMFKSTLVGWRFMELQTAHAIWKTGFLVMVGGLLALLYFIG